MDWITGSFYYRIFIFLFASLGLKKKDLRIFSEWTFLIFKNVHFAFYHRSFVFEGFYEIRKIVERGF
jgi:hypothetical protein